MTMIAGPMGLLETELHSPKGEEKPGIAVVCHPHPLYDGTMNNKVVTTLVRTFNEIGLAAVRFNFRGVGKSKGHYAQGVGEVEDLLAVVNWAQQQFPKQPLYLAGFSFGAYIAASAVQQLDAQQLVLIAPPVHHFDFNSLPEFACPWIVVQGDQDEVVPVEQVLTWVQSRQHPPTLIKMEGVSHFFHGKLIELKNQLIAKL